MKRRSYLWSSFAELLGGKPSAEYWHPVGRYLLRPAAWMHRAIPCCRDRMLGIQVSVDDELNPMPFTQSLLAMIIGLMESPEQQKRT